MHATGLFCIAFEYFGCRDTRSLAICLLGPGGSLSFPPQLISHLVPPSEWSLSILGLGYHASGRLISLHLGDGMEVLPN